MSGFVLTTKRLSLREPRPADADGFIAFYGTERARFVGGPERPDQAWDRFARLLGHWQIHGFGMFMVTRRDSGTPIGFVGPWFPKAWPEREIGWVLYHPEDEGKGLAFEAAQACIEDAWTRLQWPTFVSYIEPGNGPSIALAERLGATLDATAPKPTFLPENLVYRHPAPREGRP